MTGEDHADVGQIRSALEELDSIARDEYGPRITSLADLLADPTPLGAKRVQRVVGISLKKEFADKHPRLASDPNSETHANFSWPWKLGTPQDQAHAAPSEFALLEELRKPGPWNEPSQWSRRPDSTAPVDWDTFKQDVETERGLFKIAILYAQDRINWRETRTFEEYLEADESPRFEAGLDIADVLANELVVGPLLLILGVPPVAVGIAVVGLRYGYRLATETNRERVGDQRA